MLVTISSFLLPTDSTSKITTNGFSILGSLLYLIYFANTLPFHEANVPIVGKYFGFVKNILKDLSVHLLVI